jgi:predicted nuclease with TOPRIM domain
MGDWEAKYRDAVAQLKDAKDEFAEFESTSMAVEKELEAEVDSLHKTKSELEARLHKLEDAHATLRTKYEEAQREVSEPKDGWLGG